MKTLLFDSGPVISLTTSNLLDILEPLKRRFDGAFVITPAVKRELVERPLTIKRFEFEALQVSKIIDDGILTLADADVSGRTAHLLKLANRCYQSKGENLHIVHEAEIGLLAAAREFPDSTMVIDERTMRLLLEDPEDLRKLLEQRLHAPVTLRKDALRELQREAGTVRMIRSAELAVTAIAIGVLQGLAPHGRYGQELLLDAVLWRLKSNGCGISAEEIEEVKELMRKHPSRRERPGT